MKNIILCSDGTGNTGGKVNGTNVWRLYEAIDRGHQQPRQVAFYDDGVGTESWKPLKLLGGATGYGLTRNVTRLYGFLVQNFEPGDRIFLFGFSRGAFTVRVLANILFYCGIANRFNKEANRDHTPEEIHKIAQEAVQAYKDRTDFEPNQGAPDTFRAKYGLLNPDPGGEQGRFPIHFVGVWDTVEAYGLPIDELTDAYWFLFKLRFREKGGVRENDLHPLIENAYHALSTDDERHTFHPILWHEGPPFDPDTQARLPDSQKIFNFGPKYANRAQKVEQVWFAGAHANVGGGYAQDALACVPLVWMMNHASHCGLALHSTLVNDYRRTADIHGKHYDPRAGLGVYYRYRPRDLRVVCAQAGIRTAKIHASVVERVRGHDQAYAPTGMPRDIDYVLVDATASTPQEVNSAGRIERQTFVDDLIWQRRVLYFVFLIWTTLLVTAALAMRGQPVPEIGDWDRFKQFAYAFVRPVLDTVIWLVPSYFESGLVALRNDPYLLLAFLLAFIAIFAMSRKLDRAIRRNSNIGWQIGYGIGGIGATTPPIVARWIAAPIRALRTSRWANWIADRFYRAVLPWIVLAGSLVAVVWVGFWWVYPPVQLAAQGKIQGGEVLESAEINFDTSNPMLATEVLLKAGVKYRISVKSADDWMDGSLPASPDGLKQPRKHDAILAGFKRVKDEPWFKLMGSIGPDEDELIPIAHSREFWASKNGRLYLFVNDAPGWYWNNRGTAVIRVERLVN